MCTYLLLSINTLYNVIEMLLNISRNWDEKRNLNLKKRTKVNFKVNRMN